MAPYSRDFAKYGWRDVAVRCAALRSLSEASVRKTYSVLSDGLGSPAALVDRSGTTATEYAYSAFGEAYSRSGTAGWQPVKETGTKNGNARLFAGREFDRETGLYYSRARTYSPELGRFLQRDPVGQNDQVNPYTYVANNPLRYTDPTGREKKLASQYDQTQLILDIFNEAGRDMYWSRQWDISTSLLPNEWHLQDGTPYLNAKLAFASESWYIYNIKSNKHFRDVSIRIDWLEHVWFNWNLVSLATLGDVLYWYNWQKIGFKYSTVESGAYVATLAKFDYEWATLNEIPDRILYRAGYVLGTETDVGKIDADNLSRRLFPADKLSHKIEAEIKSPVVTIDEIMKR